MAAASFARSDKDSARNIEHMCEARQAVSAHWDLAMLHLQRISPTECIKTSWCILNIFYSLPEASVSRLCFKQYPENGRKKNDTWSIGAFLSTFFLPTKKKNVGCFQPTRLTRLTNSLTTHHTGQKFFFYTQEGSTRKNLAA